MRANHTPKQFSSWHRFDPESISEFAPDAPAAVQLRSADGLLDYPDGQSAMVCYLFATESACTALLELHGRRGSSPEDGIEFRTYQGDHAREWLVELMYGFESTFGALPTWNQRADRGPEGSTE